MNSLIREKVNQMPTISGKVRSLNLSPKGFHESFLLGDGKRIVQINFARDAGENPAKGLKRGQTVSVNAEALDDERPSNHPVYCWIDRGMGTYEGVVKQINYARHGEANGTMLENGEFVHMHPEGARAVKLRIGQTLSVEGDAKTSPAGHTVIEARKVNGLALKHLPAKAKKKHA
jgi:hypothetical protein